MEHATPFRKEETLRSPTSTNDAHNRSRRRKFAVISLFRVDVPCSANENSLIRWCRELVVKQLMQMRKSTPVLAKTG
jgi:hypothetical protein